MTGKNVAKYLLAAAFFIVASSYCLSVDTHENFNSQNKKHTGEIITTSSMHKDNKTYIGTYTTTAYDLSYQSCAKMPEHPAYGITASGNSLKQHTRESAMAIAVDPDHIPLGSKVLLVFSGSKAKYSGVYTAMDTGSAIKQNRIDIFFGDFENNVSQEALNFGVSEADVYILN